MFQSERRRAWRPRLRREEGKIEQAIRPDRRNHSAPGFRLLARVRACEKVRVESRAQGKTLKNRRRRREQELGVGMLPQRPTIIDQRANPICRIIRHRDCGVHAATDGDGGNFTTTIRRPRGRFKPQRTQSARRTTTDNYHAEPRSSRRTDRTADFATVADLTREARRFSPQRQYDTTRIHRR